MSAAPPGPPLIGRVSRRTFIVLVIFIPGMLSAVIVAGAGEFKAAQFAGPETEKSLQRK